jgi:hypothetical protein
MDNDVSRIDNVYLGWLGAFYRGFWQISVVDRRLEVDADLLVQFDFSSELV